jgi:prevent-host-death family protein
MTRVTASNARDNFSETINRVTYGGERVVIHRRGKELAAIVPIADLKLIEEQENAIDVREARKTLAEMKRSGEKPISWDKVKRKLGL